MPFRPDVNHLTFHFTGTPQTISVQTAVRAGGNQIIVAPSGASARQQIVVASSGQPGVARQIVMSTQGGTTSVRPGQILQVRTLLLSVEGH